ncbi:hypothetical protein GCM10015536_19870 [Streptomyces griseomycini]|nr:hypothetical protein GCM10015536_19870 [Streptomyces griseomycini]
MLSRRRRRRLADRGPEAERPSGLAARWSATVERRPRSVAVLAVVLMAALAVPLLSLFVGTIVGLGFPLLLLAFRSLVVPLTAAVMNLLAAAASFGVLVAIFQWGWGPDLLGLGEEGPIASFLPIIMLSLLFGLSTDHQVFLVSRMHEEWVHTRDNARAVRVGLAQTSRVIDSAALIMVCVFLAFVLSGDYGAAMAGVGLAAVALDAFIPRTALVPAAMHLLGRSDWWLPAALEKRLPHLAVEPKEDAAGPVAPAASVLPAQRGSASVVHGFVRTADGEPVEGAAVALPAPGGRRVDRVVSLADGAYVVSVPSPGGYLLPVTAAPYGSRAARVDVAGGPLVYDVELTPGEVDSVN